MRQSIASIALIRKTAAGRTLWLAQWNRNWQCFNLVGGHKHADETFRECMIREISEELGIAEHEDFEAAEHPAAHLEYTAWSEGAQQQTAYTMELFDVELLDTAKQKVDSDPQNRWLDETEIRARAAKDGSKISPTMKRLLLEVNWGS